MRNSIINEDLENIIADIQDPQKYMNKKILITGVNGLIGTYLTFVFLLLNEKYDLKSNIYVLTRNHQSTLDRFQELGHIGGLHVIDGDLSVPEDIALPTQMDIIIHAASQTSPWHFKNDPVGTLLVNSIGTNFLLNYARTAGCESFLYLSTREIYGENYDNREFADEQYYGPLDPSQLRSCYPESKKFGEMCCTAYKAQYGLNCKIARIAHTYGPSMKLDDGRIIGEFVSRVISNEDIVLNTDGSSLISLTYISDVVSGLLRLLVDPAMLIANIADDDNIYSVKEFAQTIASLGSSSQVKFREKNSHTPMYLSKQPALLKSDRIKTTGWHVRMNIVDGLKRTIDYYHPVIGR